MSKQRRDQDLGDFTTTAEVLTSPEDTAHESTNGAAGHADAMNGSAKESSGASSKSQAIRDAFAELGPRASGRDILAKLAEGNITVNESQISSIRLKLYGKSRRRKKRAAKAPVAAPRPAVVSKPAPEGHIAVAHLIAAKAFAKKAGSIAQARQAVELLKRLV